VLRKEVALTDATTTDAGEFTAIAATWDIDRQNEVIRQGAFAQTIKNWQGSRKAVPVHWEHRGEAENIIGSIDPTKMIESDEGLHVEGKLDLEGSEVARQAWRSMKNGTISLSFGFLVTDARKRDDGVRELLGIDLFEVSLTPAPANPQTRVTSMKSARGADDLAGILDGLYTGRSKAAYRESDFARSVDDYLRWPDDREVRQLMDREVEKLAAELKTAKEEKAVESFRVHTFEV
jgi:HK97 family phage prohead protease